MRSSGGWKCDVEEKEEGELSRGVGVKESKKWHRQNEVIRQSVHEHMC